MKLIFQHCIRSWRHHFSLQLMTVFVLSIVLTILSFVFGIRQNLTHLNATWGDNLELTVYVKESAKPDSISKFVEELKGRKEVGKAEIVSKDEALNKFVARMGALAPEFIRSPDFENPLPPSVEVKLKDDRSPKEKVAVMQNIARQIKENEIVEDVSYGQGWIENWAGFLTSIHVLSGAAVALTVFLGLLIIGNSVRVSLSQRREEIEILELVGATSRWIRTPFICEGAMLGLFASILSGIAGSFLQSLAFNYMKQSLSFWTVLQELRPLSLYGWLCVSVIGITFGALGAYVCVRHLNSGWSAAERCEV